MIQPKDLKTKKSIWCLPTCVKCSNFMQNLSLVLNAKTQLTLLFSCQCTQKGHITVEQYYEQFMFYYNTTSKICKCSLYFSICYCFTCEQYICKDCYFKHKWHFLLKKQIQNYKKICKCIINNNNKNYIYCSVCDQFFCKMCSKDLHKKHKLISFKKINEQLIKASSQESINLFIKNITSSVVPQYQKNVKNDLKKILNLLTNCFMAFEKYPLALFIKYQSIFKLTNLKTEKIYYSPRYQIPLLNITSPEKVLPSREIYFSICLLDNGKFVSFESYNSISILIIYSKYLDSIEFTCTVSPTKDLYPLSGSEVLLSGENTLEIYDCSKNPRKLIHSEYSEHIHEFIIEHRHQLVLEISKTHYLINNHNTEILLWDRHLDKYKIIESLPDPKLKFKMYLLNNDDKVVIYSKKGMSLWSTKTWKQIVSLSESILNEGENFKRILSVMEGENNQLIISGRIMYWSSRTGFLCFVNKEDLSFDFSLEGREKYSFNIMEKINKSFFLGISFIHNSAEIVEMETGTITHHFFRFCNIGCYSGAQLKCDYIIKYKDIFIFIRQYCNVYVFSLLC